MNQPSPWSVHGSPLLVLGLVLGLVLSAGCSGGGKSERLVPVSGRVLVDGLPLTVGTVTFQPDEAKGNKSTMAATGMVDGSGNYKLFTNNQEGAPLGWYKVGVTPMGMPMGGNQPATPADPTKPGGVSIGKKYQQPASSGIEIEVVESAPAGAYDIKISK